LSERTISLNEAVRTPTISIVGRTGAGRKTVIEKLVPRLKSLGYRIAVAKHDVHGFEMDHEGKDT
jgi:molybdopterin-guanine dinucleotide biosynthesis protein MobB